MENTTTKGTYKTLVDEVNERIKNSLKINDLIGVKIEQPMLEAPWKKVNKRTADLKQVRNEQKEIKETKANNARLFLHY